MLNKRKIIAIFAGLFPVAAFADISGTLTVNANTQFSMDTATTVTSGADFLWDGTTLTPQGNAKAFANPALTGASTYALLTGSLLASEASLGSSAPITGLAANAIVGYMTNGGNFGKLLVTSASGTLVFQYTTYISVTPKITGVLNNYSSIPAGLPNSGIAPGTLFIIKGSTLASATSVSALQDPSKGIPTSLNGASLSVTVGGVTTTPGIYYAIATQIAAVLPSNTPVGTGTVTVTYSGATATANITVVPGALGLDSYDGTGSGLGVATNATTGVLYNYTNSIPPGTTVVLWGSGLGATPDSDTIDASAPHAVTNPPTFYIGSTAVTPLYAGRSVYPGVDQINLTIPASAPTGCAISVVAVSGTGASSIVSNTVSLPIGSGVCSDPALGINGNQLGNPSQSGNFTTASLEITQSTSAKNVETTSLGGGFESFQNFTSASSGSAFSLSSCIVTTSAGAGGLPSGTFTGLDAGTITVTGPAGSQTMMEIANPLSSGPSGAYSAQVANSFLPATGGTFTFTGSGGANVGAFTASISLSNLITWTNESSITSITRTNGQNITWSGGAANTYVYVTGSSASTGGASATFTCYAPASAGQLTVPSYVLLALPAGNGTLGVANAAAPVTFTASGLSTPGVIIGSVGFALAPTYN